MPLVKPYHDDASKARNMVLFADLQRVTVRTISAPVLQRMLKMHRQYTNNFAKRNQKYMDAKQFFKDFEADTLLRPMARKCGRYHFPTCHAHIGLSKRPLATPSANKG